MVTTRVPRPAGAKAMKSAIRDLVRGIETRGVSDHGFIHSIYFRDPNGYVIELAAKTARHDAAMDPATNGAREKLERWTAARRRPARVA
ncbi:hypothetical protein D3C83_83990 [compost metagenome]